ncbi:hypothetical protein F5Y16DRAFT_363512 [Xylariaceae sp. FL0255]|nr:hypothetical protein F5Y16DRAFT_363512 [Xylariaceae sp. FL0255]
MPSSLYSGYLHIPKNQFQADMSPPKTKWYRCITVRVPWLIELASLLIAVSALVGIFFLLAFSANKPQPALPSLISINALLSILTSVMKAAILFPVARGISELKWIWYSRPRPLGDIDRWDAASKGPLGSFLLICRHPTSFPTVMGAMVVCLSIAVDPFTQQILSFYSCPQPTSTLSTIPRTNNYTAGDTLLAETLATLEPVVPPPDNVMTLALYKGLLDPPANTSMAVTPFCPSGNCTFTTRDGFSYNSLAVCWNAQDISSTISGNGNFDSWNFSTPTNSLNYTNNIASDEVSDIVLSSIETYDSYVAGLLSFEVLMLNLDCEHESGISSNCSNIGARAFNATIYPCVQSYSNARVSNAVFSETITSEVALEFIQPNQSQANNYYYSLAGNLPPIPGLDCSPSITPDGKKTQLTSLQNGTRYAVYQPTLLQDLDALYFDPRCTYELDRGPASSISAALGGFFSGQTLTAPKGLSEQVFGDQGLVNIWSNGTANISTFEKYVDGLATSITAAMRTEGDASNSQPAQGQVNEIQTCVRAHWLWIFFPAGLLLLTTIFLLIVIYLSNQSRRLGSVQGGRKPWKSSTLPLLWCGLDDSTRYEYPSFNDIEDMENYSDHVYVRLAREEDLTSQGKASRWRFQLQDIDRRQKQLP